jgi:phosphoadenosine phosphosulfate reductase
MNERKRGALDDLDGAPQAAKTDPTALEALKAKARELDEEFATLTADERIRRAYGLFGQGLVATTSFGRDAGLLLHHLHRLQVPIRVWFIDTTFHFPETLEYRDTLVSAWKLDLREARTADPDNRRYAVQGGDGILSITDTDACCAINKVAVQAAFLGRSDVTAFLAGLRRDQSATRKDTPFVQVQKGKIKICPFADWPQQDVEMYLGLWEVPPHPLAARGYTSIGCSPATCTRKPTDPGDARSGRWAGDSKTECGLHLDNEP